MMLEERLMYRGFPGRLTGRRRDVRGLSIYERGAPGPLERPPVVLVHGIGVSSRYFGPLAVRLAAHVPVVAPDLPGFGQSDSPCRTLTLPELADALADWMAAAGIPRTAFVANSFGCQVVLELAVRRPERVERAVLLGPTTDAHARTASHQLLALAVDAMREPPELVLLAAWDYLRAGPRRCLAALRESLRDRPEDKAARIQVPVLVVRGERDPIVSQAWVEELSRRLPNARLAVVPGAAHAVNYNSPQELVGVVAAFLSA